MFGSTPAAAVSAATPNAQGIWLGGHERGPGVYRSFHKCSNVGDSHAGKFSLEGRACQCQNEDSDYSQGKRSQKGQAWRSNVKVPFFSLFSQLESELTRLQKQHAALFESAERRESLERTARAKLSTEVKRLTAVNRELLSSSNSLQNLSSYSFGSDLDAYKKELSKKDMTIAQLISQSMCCKALTTDHY